MICFNGTNAKLLWKTVVFDTKKGFKNPYLICYYSGITRKIQTDEYTRPFNK